MAQQERQTYAVCTAKEGTIWDAAGGTVILEPIAKMLAGWGFMINPYNQFVANKIMM